MRPPPPQLLRIPICFHTPSTYHPPLGEESDPIQHSCYYMGSSFKLNATHVEHASSSRNNRFTLQSDAIKGTVWAWRNLPHAHRKGNSINYLIFFMKVSSWKQAERSNRKIHGGITIITRLRRRKSRHYIRWRKIHPETNWRHSWKRKRPILMPSKSTCDNINSDITPSELWKIVKEFRSMNVPKPPTIPSTWIEQFCDNISDLIGPIHDFVST